MQRTKSSYAKRRMKQDGSPEFIDISDCNKDEIHLSYPNELCGSWNICHLGHDKVRISVHLV